MQVNPAIFKRHRLLLVQRLVLLRRSAPLTL